MAVDRGRYGNSLSDSGKDLANLLVAALMVGQAAAKDPSPSASEAEAQALRQWNGQSGAGVLRAGGGRSPGIARDRSSTKTIKC